MELYTLVVCRKSGRTYISTKRVASDEVKDQLKSLRKDAERMSEGDCQPISTNITLISKTMQAWPDILTGRNQTLYGQA